MSAQDLGPLTVPKTQYCDSKLTLTWQITELSSKVHVNIVILTLGKVSIKKNIKSYGILQRDK